MSPYFNPCRPSQHVPGLPDSRRSNRDSGAVDCSGGASSTTGIENNNASDGLTYGCNSTYLAGAPLEVFFLPPGVTNCLPTAPAAAASQSTRTGSSASRCTCPSSTSRARTTSAAPGSRSRYIGCEFAKAVLVTWGEPGFCPPQCAGPLKVECTGLLKPGSTWNFLGAQVPDGLEGRHRSSSSRAQAALRGRPRPSASDDIAADYMCETLFFGVVGDCDDYRRFKKAYNEGLTFAGIPQRHGRWRRASWPSTCCATARAT